MTPPETFVPAQEADTSLSSVFSSQDLPASEGFHSKEFWRKLLSRLAPTISEPKFMTWFANTAVIGCEAGVLTIGVPSTFAHKMLTEVFHVKIFQAAKELMDEICHVVYEVHSSLSSKGDGRVVDLKEILAKDKPVRRVPGTNQVSLGNGLRSRVFNPKYTLDNFIVGKDNRLPHAACTAVSQSPGGMYNPLFIFGRVGLGKTHLLQATGMEILRNFQDKKIMYITSENFVNEVVEAIKKRSMNEFKARYRKVDVLIVDDVQFFGERATSQEEFFHTFNDLYDSNKQLILSSDRPPQEMDSIDQRLKSRFGMGMVVEVLPPDYETRLAILQSKSQELGMIIDREVLECIAYHVQSSVRELEGFLKQCVSYVELEHSVPTVRMVEEMLERLHGVKPSAVPAAIAADIPLVERKKDDKDFVTAVCEYFKVSHEALLGPDRRKEIQVPRQICMYLIRQELGYAYEKIGQHFGGRNHTTVLHASEKMIRELKKDSRLMRDVNAIKKMLGY